MKTIHSIEQVKAAIASYKKDGQRIGFVPTMGNLHRGHLRLIEEASRTADKVIASIFVNPMQFGANEDLDKYPRTLEQDQAQLQALNTDLLFAPTAREMYPNGLDKHLKMNMPHMAGVLCGKSRPTHFEGVCTVVAKLFNIISPDLAVFGKKDLQQLLIIKQMTSDLCLDIEISGVDTEREANGLAMSSRNSLLSSDEKKDAAIIHQLLRDIQTAIKSGGTHYDELVKTSTNKLNNSLLKTDYLEIRNLDDLSLAIDGETYDKLGVFTAAFAEKTRLIDNITIEAENYSKLS